MVERIVASPTYQELGSHTFSHIDVGDQGVNEQVALAEFELCQQLARNWGRKLNSVVFPHNFAGHLSALEATGYRCYRGLNCEWWLLGMDPNKQLRWKPVRLFLQPLRYLDERWPICPPLPPARRVGKLWEIPHSMLFQGPGCFEIRFRRCAGSPCHSRITHRRRARPVVQFLDPS